MFQVFKRLLMSMFRSKYYSTGNETWLPLLKISRNFSTYRSEKKILYIISSLKIWREIFLLNDIFD